MTLEEAFTIINNLDLDEGLKRKLGPTYSLIQVRRDGQIASVERFKQAPTEREQFEALERHPGCIQINGRPGMYESIEDFRARVSKSMWLFKKMKH